MALEKAWWQGKNFGDGRFGSSDWRLEVRAVFEMGQIVDPRDVLQYCLGGGFIFQMFTPRKLGKMNPIWLRFFQMGWFNHQPDLLLALKWFPKDTSVPVSAIDLVKTWAFEIRWCRKAIFCSLWVRRQTELFMKFHLADACGGIRSDRPSVSTTNTRTLDQPQHLSDSGNGNAVARTNFVHFFRGLQLKCFLSKIWLKVHPFKGAHLAGLELREAKYQRDAGDRVHSHGF